MTTTFYKGYGMFVRAWNAPIAALEGVIGIALWIYSGDPKHLAGFSAPDLDR